MIGFKVEDSCIGCGLCAKICVRQGIKIENGKAVPDPENCTECSQCVSICPVDAMVMTDYDRSEILEVDEERLKLDPDDFLYFQKCRRSIRFFKDTPVTDEQLAMLIEAGRYSPTGSNSQKNKFTIIKDRIPEIRNKVVNALYELSNDDEKLKAIDSMMYKYSWKRLYTNLYEKGQDKLFYNAPVVILITNDGPNPLVNGALAASRMELLANAMGLGVCYIGFLKRGLDADPSIKEDLSLEDNEEYVVAFSVGYPDISFVRTANRKPARVKYI